MSRPLRAGVRAAAGSLAESMRDLAPVVGVVLAFQVLVVREPIADAGALVLGILAVVVGLALFVQGLRLALFPLGEGLAGEFAQRGSVLILVAFAFLLGFGTTVAEPALLTVTNEAGRIRAESLGHASGDGYALALRYTVAASVGTAIALGVIRIVKGWPIHFFIIAGYAVIIGLTPFAPTEIVGIAYDSGGVTTSTITVPLVAALGIGLSLAVKGRSPMIDGFGLIAFASLMPIIFVLVFGIAG